MIPGPVVAALEHVREHYPDVTQVTFSLVDADCGGLWTYRTETGEAPVFGDQIDMSLLDAALDAALPNMAPAAAFPITITYTLEGDA